MSTPLNPINTKGTKDIYQIVTTGKYEIQINPEEAYILSCTPTRNTNVIMQTLDSISGSKTIEFTKNPIILGENLIDISVSNIVPGSKIIIELVKVATLK